MCPSNNREGPANVAACVAANVDTNPRSHSDVLTPMKGKQLGPYVLGETLGTGGMGTVDRATVGADV